MSEFMDKLIDDVEEAEENKLPEEYVRFMVDDDQKAEWCLDKIRQANAEKEKWTSFYMGCLKKICDKCDNTIAFMEEKLKPYFASVPHKETKTQESYQLPSGKLVLKRQAPEFERDEEKLVPWLREEHPDMIKTKLSVDWMNFKKQLTICADGSVADPDGEIVPGITAVERPDKFVVEVK